MLPIGRSSLFLTTSEHCGLIDFETAEYFAKEAINPNPVKTFTACKLCKLFRINASVGCLHYISRVIEIRQCGVKLFT